MFQLTSKKKFYYYFLVFSTVSLFIFLRTYKISDSLFFQNDIGRDYLYLIEWQQSGKPPLLGPQNSALPFNQSAFYFYLLFPVFFLSNGWFLSSHLTSLIFHLIVFVAGSLYLFKSQQKKLWWVFFTVFLLGAIHPQLIAQHRYIWNPSFVWSSVVVATLSFYQLFTRFNAKWLWLFAISITFAIAMSVSAGPSLLAFLIMAMLMLKKNLLKIIGVVFLAGNFWFLPYWFFEFRYDFQIIKRVFGRKVLVMDPSRLTLEYKLESFGRYLLDIKLPWYLVIICLGLMLVLALMLLRKRFRENNNLTLSEMSLWLLLITTAISLVFPVTIEAHYIFPFLAFFHMIIADTLVSTKKRQQRILLFVLLIATIWWLRPKKFQSYIKPAPRSYEQIERCFQSVCSSINEPVFVSVQSKHYRYHTGPEFRYMALRHGCQMRYVETDFTAAEIMMVVADQSDYIHGETLYDELTLFGEASEEKVIGCENEIKIHLLRKTL